MSCPQQTCEAAVTAAPIVLFSGKPICYLKQVGFGGTAIQVSTKEDLLAALEKLQVPGKFLTFAIEVGILGHLTVTFLGSSEISSPKFNPLFDECFERIALFLEKLPATLTMTTYGQCTFGPLPVFLVTFTNPEMHTLIQETSCKGIQEGSTPTRLPHVTVKLFPDTIKEKRELIEQHQIVLPMKKEEEALAFVLEQIGNTQ